MAAHRYWRINWLTTRSASFAAINGVSLASVGGGPTLTAAKAISSATASSFQGGHGASVASTATGGYWGSSGAAPQWWRADLGAAVEVSTVTIQVVALVDVYGPQAFTIDSSPDDSTWTTRQSFTASSWTGNTEQAFHLTTPVSARYWRVSINSNFGGAGAVALSFVDFSGAWASSEQDTHPANWPIAALGYWGNNPAASGTGWWAYDFGSTPPDIKEVKLTDISLDSGFAPITWTLDYSDNATAWTTAKSFTSGSWSGSLTQTFSTVANTTWSPTDLTGFVTLSGGNLTATSTSIGSNAGRASDRQRSGKYYWEVTCNTFASANSGIGIANPFATMSSFISSNNAFGCLAWRASPVYINGVSSGVGIGTIVSGSVVCISLDLDNRTIAFRLGAGGTLFTYDISALGPPDTPIYPAYALGTSAEQVTANFGDSAFVGTVPSGFTAGFPAGAVIPTSDVVSGLVRETLLAEAGTLRTSALIREVLRSTSTGAGTYIVTDGMVREVLRSAASAAPASHGGSMITVIL